MCYKGAFKYYVSILEGPKAFSFGLRRRREGQSGGRVESGETRRQGGGRGIKKKNVEIRIRRGTIRMTWRRIVR